MAQHNEKVVKKGVFKRIVYSSAKKYACEKGELILTTKNLTINCEGARARYVMGSPYVLFSICSYLAKALTTCESA